MSISVLSIAQAEGLQHPIRTRKLAESRGINHARFTLRELLTSQKQSTAAPMPGSWQNWIEDYDNGAQVVRPSNKEELMGAVLFAVKGGMKIRAVGSGHSHSKAAEPEDVFVDLSRLSGMLSHRDWLKQSPPGLTSNDQLVRIQAGTTLKRLNRNLLKSRDLALANMGSFDGQTIAGAISTATHGTGVALPTLADMVASMEMVTAIRSVSGKPIVQMLRIEPTDGITDRSKFEADQAVHDTVLLQDDDTFYSAVVSYGCMGIAYAYTLKVREEYWLREESTLEKWSTLRSRLRQPVVRLDGDTVPEVVTEDRHYSFLVNVAAAQNGDDPDCLVRTHDITEPLSRPHVFIGSWPPERKKGLMRCLASCFQGILTDLVGAPNPERPHPHLGGRLRDLFFKPEANQDPFRGPGHSSISYIALRREKDKDNDDPPDPPPPAISMEIAVPSQRVVEAVDVVLEQIKNIQTQDDIFFSVPMGVRFVAPSDHYLASQYRRSCAMIEVPFFIDAGRKRRRAELRDQIAKPQLERIERAVADHPDLKGRPHLGKHNSLTRPRLDEAFPKFDVWLKIYGRYNAFGLFDNSFTRQMGLS